MAIGDPTGEDLCVGTTDGDTLAAHPTWTEREITFDVPYELVEGTQYAIVIRALDFDYSPTGPFVFWVETSGAGGYTSGTQFNSTNSGSSWTSYSPDMWFKTKADGVEKDTYTFGDVGTQFTIDFIWNSQTFTPGSTYEISSVVLKLCRYLAPGEITVSIKAVEVAPTPQKVTTPSPIDTYTDMTLDWQQFTWVADEDAPDEEVYNVYWGTTSGDLDLIALEVPLLSIASSYLTAVAGTGVYSRTYYWRVDTYWPSTDETAVGDEWSFTTIAFDQPKVSYVLITGGSGSGPYDDPPGVEGTDWRYTGENNLVTLRRLVAAANNKIWIENN